MKREALQRVRDQLPRRLNAGILMGDGGLCILGHMLVSAGHLPIAIYASTLALSDPLQGESAIDAVAREYALPREAVLELARCNDRTPLAERVAAVRAALDRLLAGGDADFAPRGSVSSSSA